MRSGARAALVLAWALAVALGCGADPGEAPSPRPAPEPPAPPRAPAGTLPEGVEARVEEALAAVEAHPEDAAARLELAMVYDANALFDLAARAYEQAAARAPDDPRALYHLGRCRVLLGDWEGAREAFLRAIDAGADGYAPAHWRLASLELDADRLDEAEAAARRATEVAPGDPTGPMLLARVLLQRGEAGRAAGVLEPLASALPDDGMLHALLGRAWSLAGDPRAAEALALAGESTAAYADPWRAEVQGRAAGFLTDIDRAKELLQAGRAAEALEIALPLFEAEPGNVTLQGLVTAALVAEKEFDRALELLDRARAAGPPHYRTEMNVGLVHHKAGDARGALPHLRRALELNPGYGPGHAYLGGVEAELGDWNAAAASLERAVALGDHDLKTLLELGKARGNGGDLGGATLAFEDARRRYPRAPAAWGYLGAAYADVGRIEEAREALAALERLDPDHPLAAAVRARIARAEAAR